MSDVEYQQGRADQAAGTVDTTRTADRAYVAGLAAVRTEQGDEFLASLPDPGDQVAAPTGPTAGDLADIAGQRAHYAQMRDEYAARVQAEGLQAAIPDGLIGHRDAVYLNDDGTVRHIEADVNGYDEDGM